MHDDDYLYVLAEVTDDDLDDGEWGEVALDSAHDDGTSTDADDYKYRITYSSSGNTYLDQVGTSGSWGSDGSWTDAAVKIVGSETVYEFQIPLTGTKGAWDSASDGAIAGFDFRAYGDSGVEGAIFEGVDAGITWTRGGSFGSEPSALSNPSLWGDLFYDRPKLWITEVASKDGAKEGGQLNEGVELYNAGPDTININRISISDQDTSQFTKDIYTSDVTTELNIASGDYIVIWTFQDTDEMTKSGSWWDFYCDGGNGADYLGDTGDELHLYYYYNGMGIDYMEYGSET
jgi:hypothetical protein